MKTSQYISGLSGLVLASFVSGCASVNHDGMDYHDVGSNTMNESRKDVGQMHFVEPQTVNTNALNAKDTSDLFNELGNLPSWNGSVFTKNGTNQLYLSGPINASAFVLSQLEDIFDNKENNASLVMGSPHAFSQAGQSYQLNNDFAVRFSNYSDSTNCGIGINLEKIRGNFGDNMTVSVNFGLNTNDVKLHKTTLDLHLLTEAGLNGGMGYAVGGGAGLAFFIAPSVVNHLEGLAEKGRIPNNASYYSGFTPLTTAQSSGAANLRNEIDYASRLNVNGIIVCDYTNKDGSSGVGVIDLPCDVSNLTYSNAIVKYNLKEKDVSRFVGTLVDGIRGGALWYVGNNQTIINGNNHVSGGRSGEPGGN